MGGHPGAWDVLDEEDGDDAEERLAARHARLLDVLRPRLEPGGRAVRRHVGQSCSHVAMLLVQPILHTVYGTHYNKNVCAECVHVITIAIPN